MVPNTICTSEKMKIQQQADSEPRSTPKRRIRNDSSDEGGEDLEIGKDIIHEIALIL